MARVCNNCRTVSNEEKNESINVSVPYVAHEAIVARQERQIKRLWIALIAAISMLFASFTLFVWYESQFETITYEQDGEGINNVNYGEQGDLNNGAESENQAEKEE